MSSTYGEATLRSVFVAGEETLRRSWGWLLAFGIAMIVLGMVALAVPFIFTVAITLYVGCVLIAAGIVSSIQAFRIRTWGGFFLAVFTAILDLVVGFFMVTQATDAAIVMTWLLALFFLVTGFFRTIFSLTARFPNWGWSVLSGLISLVLGVMILRQWPLSGFWVIGLFVGVELVFRGWTLVMLALAVKPSSKGLSQPSAPL
jgi:uncharacterized membrane protein HdeD (DUF308 family)